MLRVCDGTDPNLLDKDGQPDTCGLEFDDVQRSVIHPHVFIPTQEEKAALLAELEGVFLESTP